MKKLIFIILILILISGCAPTTKQEIETTLEPSTATTQETEVKEPEHMPEPTPVVFDTSIELPTIPSYNEEFLTHISIENNPDFITEMETPIAELISLDDEAFYVEFDPNRSSNEQLNRPSMPTYTWYINGSHSDIISEVVIEFDLLETIYPLHPAYFGYNKGYLITLHHFQDIPLFPTWIGDNDMNTHYTIGANRDVMIKTHEFGEDLRNYATQNGSHIKIVIPYSEFQSTAKDLTLQFFPGTTFSNFSVSLLGTYQLNTDIIDAMTRTVEYPQRDLRNDVMMPILHVAEDDLIQSSDGENGNNLGELIWAHPVMGAGLTINDDGSINMPVSLYYLGEYENEIQGKYAVIPEGLVSVFTTLSSYSYFGYINGNEQQRNQNERMIVDFMFENLMDETGQFFGIYDIKQQKIVAIDRKSPALPILSALLINSGRRHWDTEEYCTLTDNEIDFLVNSIIANDIVRVDDKLFYAPYGVNDNGVMKLKLDDFAFSDELFYLLTEYSGGSDRLDEEFGCAMLLEGLANSLKLVLESQEKNATRLPSTSIEVMFSDNGKTYELYPSEIFDINNSFFSLGLISYNELDLFYDQFEQVINESLYTRNLSGAKDGEYSICQKEYIYECEAVYAEYYNYYTIVNTLYQSWLHTNNFLQMQPSETAYASMYNVHTGEMIEILVGELYHRFQHFAPFINRFGTPATSANYHNLAGMFNNDTAIYETTYLLIVSFERWMSGYMFTAEQFDYSNPDLFADYGFDIWGYDSLYYMMAGADPSGKITRYQYETSGTNMVRENWRAYTMRKLNEHIQNDQNHVYIDDEFPLFYDHMPKVKIDN